MTKIYCADPLCEFNNDNGVCTAKKVALAWHSVRTVWDGRQEFSRCKTREQREIDIDMKEFLHGKKTEVSGE